eukprot:2577108-Rhodomonas_salina.1
MRQRFQRKVLGIDLRCIRRTIHFTVDSSRVRTTSESPSTRLHVEVAEHAPPAYVLCPFSRLTAMISSSSSTPNAYVSGPGPCLRPSQAALSESLRSRALVLTSPPQTRLCESLSSVCAARRQRIRLIFTCRSPSAVLESPS